MKYLVYLTDYYHQIKIYKKNVTIPDSVIELQDNCFSACKKLKTIHIPNTVKSIGKQAFSYCKSLESFTFNNNITSISEQTFNNCRELKYVYLPESLTEIQNMAFLGCDKLRDVKLPNTLKHIGDNSFGYCLKMKNVVIPEKVEIIGSYAFEDNELKRDSVVANFATTASDGKTYPVDYYNLDVIISVGYRVKSKNGVLFRQWATKVIKDYMLKGYAINQKRLEYLEKTVQLIDIANRLDNELENGEAREVIKVIGKYYKALDLLEEYDHDMIKNKKGFSDSNIITYNDCRNIIDNLKYSKTSEIFGKERGDLFKGILGNIYQSFAGQDVYPTIQEKGANLLYLLIKDHPFTDGNKRIVATI